MMERLLVLAAAVASGVGGGQSSGECGVREQAAITRCAEPLYRMRAFAPDSDTQTFTWDFFASKSPGYIHKVCGGFSEFKECVEPYREACFYGEPVKSQYGTAVVILEYLCGEVFDEATAQMGCLSRAVDSLDMGRCQVLIVSGLERLQESSHREAVSAQQAQLCTIMRQYSQCIGYPLRRLCGERAWEMVLEMVARPTHLLMPQCSLLSSFTHHAQYRRSAAREARMDASFVAFLGGLLLASVSLR